MSGGFIDLVAILLSLGGFGVDANPGAPTGAQIVAYAPADADVTVHLDAAALIPRNYRALTALPNEPAIRQSEESRRVVADIIREVETARGMVQQVAGFDITRDVSSATLWLTLPSAGDPAVLAVVRGSFPADLVDRIAATAGGAAGTIDGHKTVTSPEGDVMIGTRGGDLLFGSVALVKPRLARSWRAARVSRGSALARTRAVADRKPFAFLASHPSKQAVARMRRELGADADNFLTEFLAGHTYAAWSLHHNGVSWTWTDTSGPGYERAVMASEGVVDLMRASHFAGRGLAKFALAALGSYAGKDPTIDAVLAHRDDILKLVMRVTGDGAFKADIKRDRRARTVSVDARGAKLTDVLPIAGLLPVVGAVAFLTMAKGDAEDELRAGAAEAPASESRAVAPSGQLRVGDRYRALKRQRGVP